MVWYDLILECGVRMVCVCCARVCTRACVRAHGVPVCMCVVCVAVSVEHLRRYSTARVIALHSTQLTGTLEELEANHSH